MSLRATSTFKPRNDLGRFAEVRLTPGIREGAEEWIQAVFDRSQQLVAVDTGELKSSGEIIPTRETGKTIVCGMHYTAGHAAYVEYGTGARGAGSPGAGDVTYNPDWPGMPAQPYVRPAYDEYREQAPDFISNKIDLK